MKDTFRNINLHPANHLPSSLKKKDFDVIVIGSGPAGRNLAARTAAAGLSTIVVEEELFGGDCPYWACVPSKALLRPAEALETAKQISGAREMIQQADTVVNVEAVFARRDKFVSNWDDGHLVDLSISQNCEVVRGKGVLTGTKKVKVTANNGDQVNLEAKVAVVLATGSSPIMPDIPGLSEVEVWTPREATAANEVPGRLVVIGGGVVGCEMAIFYGTITKVTLISSADKLLPRFEPEASKRVKDALVAKGVDVHLSTHVQSFKNGANNSFKAVLSTGKNITGSKVLIATGRKPNIEGLGLDNFIDTKTLKLAVDDSLCVSQTGWLYAVGDVNGRSPLTHMGIYQARIAAMNIVAQAKGVSVKRQPWDGFSATADHMSVTQVVVTDPNIASAGLTLSQAKAKGYKVKEVTAEFQYPGAWVYAEMNYDGWAQWVIDEDRKVLLGATFVGRQAADLLHASTVAIIGQVPIPKLWHAVASFPTMRLYPILVVNSVASIMLREPGIVKVSSSLDEGDMWRLRFVKILKP